MSILCWISQIFFESQHHVNVYTIEKSLHLKTVYNECNEISKNISQYDYHLST